MSRVPSIVLAFAILLLIACGGRSEAPTGPRPPTGPWVLDVEALASTIRQGAEAGTTAGFEAQARAARVQLRVMDGGRFEGRMGGADLQPEAVAGRWSWDGTRFELRLETRGGKPVEEGVLVGTYDGTVLRLEPEDAEVRMEMVFCRP